MSTAGAILRSYRMPGTVIRHHMERGAGEERALAWVMAAGLLFFVAQLPRLARRAHLDPDSPPLEALAGGAFLGSVLIAPLFFYALAAGSHVIAKAFGGRGSFLDARLALFWALLAIAPLVLFQGLIAGFIGSGPSLTFISFASFIGFVVIWLNALIAVEVG